MEFTGFQPNPNFSHFLGVCGVPIDIFYAEIPEIPLSVINTLSCLVLKDRWDQTITMSFILHEQHFRLTIITQQKCVIFNNTKFATK